MAPLARSSPYLVALLVAIGLFAAGCGGSGSNKSTQAAATTPPATAPGPAAAAGPSTTPTSIKGSYTAHLTTDGLSAAGVDTVNVGGGGVWHLSVTAKRLTLKPPPPADDTRYSVVSVKAGRLTLAPNALCSTTEGRTQKSTFTFSQSAPGLKFVAVKVACKEDGGSLAVAPWQKGP